MQSKLNNSLNIKSRNTVIQIIFIFFSHFILFSQDNIILKNGDEIAAKVIEIGLDEVKYKKYQNLEGPTYTILKSEVFMIKYENGTKDVISDENQHTSPPQMNNTNNDSFSSSNGTLTYAERVRKIQNLDPSFSFYLGNAWLGRNGILKPFVGFDVRFRRKNVFIRGLSIGARVSFAGIDDAAYQEHIYTETVASTLNIKYIAPIPIKRIQPYFSFMIGAVHRVFYNNYLYPDWQGDRTDPIVNVGIGSNFMFFRHFGAFIEMGYFSTGYINTGMVLKIGKAEK